MKDIIRKNVKPANENDKMELIIYYRNIKPKHLIMKNNIASNNKYPLSKSCLCTSSSAHMKTASFLHLHTLA